MLQMFLELQPKIKNCLPCPPRPALPCPALSVTAALPLPLPCPFVRQPAQTACPALPLPPYPALFFGIWILGPGRTDRQTDRHCNFNILD